MLEKRIATCDRQNFRKRLIEFETAIKEFKQDDLNESNIYQVLYKTELFRNAIYKCIKLKRPMLPDYPLPGTEEGISDYEDEYSDDNINFVSYMLEGINGKENYIKIFISEKRNIEKVSSLNPEKYFEKV